ncbi:hypothetical protein Pmani_016200 [Petrolisthes manimaculis]|uniref:Uncharacterized protein n=1 Tax=Petrolisthes manimaculis TaxID=1843537 RepID=A0AAE1UAU1_9EUCA|nr:hypothetical protein Pmani_016200 [Petrolisthes manimaculis]
MTLQGEAEVVWRVRRGVEVTTVEEKPSRAEEETDAATTNEEQQPLQKILVVHKSEVGKMVLAGVMGACLGLMGGFLVMLLVGCCYLRCSRQGTLMFDRKNNTYRSADLIDAGV